MSLRQTLREYEEPQPKVVWSSGYFPQTLHGLLSVVFWANGLPSLLGEGRWVTLSAALGCLLGWHHFRLWRKLRRAERGPDVLEILAHGRSCPNWVEPKTFAEWQALQLRREDAGDGRTVWRCPDCLEVVVFQDNHGEIDFGIDP